MDPIRTRSSCVLHHHDDLDVSPVRLPIENTLHTSADRHRVVQYVYPHLLHSPLRPSLLGLVVSQAEQLPISALPTAIELSEVSGNSLQVYFLILD